MLASSKDLRFLFYLINDLSVCLSGHMTPGGLYGQPVRGGAELGRPAASSHPQPSLQPLLQSLLQPLLQPGGPAGGRAKVGRFWQIHLHGEAQQ